MQQSWIHTNGTLRGSTAIMQTRSVGRSVGLCANFEKSNYQPKLNRLSDCELNM
ncbi:MAG: hypothetical protein M3Q33_04100 [Acidobacteriota bacterium]|nr:hypothetical protein [Acidobacteriota bacterium]